MNQNVHPTRIHCNSVTSVDKAGEVQTVVTGAISKKTVYRNGTKYHLKVTERSGLSFVIPPDNYSSPRATGCFSVDVYYNYNHGNVVMDPDGMVSQTQDNDLPERVALRNSLTNVRSHTFNSMSIGTSYVIHGTEFVNKNSDRLYVEALDIVISIYRPGIPTDIIHPQSTDGNLILSNVSNVDFFKYQVEIVDPRNRIGNRYINIGGKVFTVPVTRTSTRPEGVYVTTTTGAGICSVDTEFYELEQAAELPFLHRSVDEATVHGSDTALLKRAHELKVLNLKNEQVDKDERKSIIDEVMSQLKYERDYFTLKDKDRYERRSAERRDFSELLKWLPVVITLVTAFINKPSK